MGTCTFGQFGWRGCRCGVEVLPESCKWQCLNTRRDAGEDVAVARAVVVRVEAPKDQPVIIQESTDGGPARDEDVEAEVELPAAEAQEGPPQVLLGNSGLLTEFLLRNVDCLLATQDLNASGCATKAGLQEPVLPRLLEHRAAPFRDLAGSAQLVGAEVPMASGRRGRLQSSNVPRQAALVSGTAEVLAMVHQPGPARHRQALLRAVCPEQIPIIPFHRSTEPPFLEGCTDVVSSVYGSCERWVGNAVREAAPPQMRRGGRRCKS
mmetsp:Transcript_79506/g.233722  ORF Transcript_79506/g.233722 Transcript_79506/m.233722 type:complete len:265 (+) Transcript_79506:538-1332(+)